MRLDYGVQSQYILQKTTVASALSRLCFTDKKKRTQGTLVAHLNVRNVLAQERHCSTTVEVQSCSLNWCEFCRTSQRGSIQLCSIVQQFGRVSTIFFSCGAAISTVSHADLVHRTFWLSVLSRVRVSGSRWLCEHEGINVCLNWAHCQGWNFGKT